MWVYVLLIVSEKCFYNSVESHRKVKVCHCRVLSELLTFSSIFSNLSTLAFFQNNFFPIIQCYYLTSIVALSKNISTNQAGLQMKTEKNKPPLFPAF